MARARVPLIPIEVEGRIVLCSGSHQAITRHFREDRCCRNRQRRGVAAHDGPNVLPSNEIPIPVEQDSIGFHAEPIERSSCRKTLRSRHAELVALCRRSVSNRRGATPFGNPLEERFALRFGQHLRITDPVHAPVPGNDGGPNGEWARPRAAPDLIQAHNDIVALIPVEALDFEAGGFRTGRGTCASRSHGARIPPIPRTFGQLLLRSVG